MGLATYTYNRSTSGGEIITHLINSTDGTGLHFDGAAGSIDIASPPDLGTKFSFEFIAQADSWGSANHYLVDFGPTAGAGRLSLASFSAESYNLAIYDTGYHSFGVKVLDDLKVHHLVVTIDGTAAILYDNGNQVGTTTIVAPTIDSAADAALGSYVAGGSNWDGSMFRARFFNRTLEASDVTALFENATVPFSDQYGNTTILNSGSVPAGLRWRIIEQNTVNFTTYGAADNAVGTEFVTTASIPALNANDRLQQIGCFVDYDLAFANPSPSPNGQSLMVRDRASAADGTSSTAGVVQVTPIEQLNSKSARIGTSAATPADGELMVSGNVSVGAVGGVTHPKLMLVSGTNSGDPVLQFNNGVTGTIAQIKAMQTSGTVDRLAIGTGTAEHLTIDSAGLVTVYAGLATHGAVTFTNVGKTLTFHPNYGAANTNHTYQSDVGMSHTFRVGGATVVADISSTGLVVTGGIVETNGVLKSNLLTNSGFDVWSNSTLEVVSTPFSDTDGSSHASWVSSRGTMSDGGSNLLFTYGSGTDQDTKYTLSGLTAGKLYKATLVTANGTNSWGSSDFLAALTNADATLGITTGLAAGTHTVVWEASGVDDKLMIQTNMSGAGNLNITSVKVEEVTPGCVATDALACDGWRKDATLDIWRQHNDGGTSAGYTKGGSFYSLKATSSATNDYLEWGILSTNKGGGVEKFKSRTVTFGCWVKLLASQTGDTSHVRLSLIDGAVDTYSSYHTGGDDWEWLEVTATMGALLAHDAFLARVMFDVSGKTAYISQPMLVFGSAIGSGNYSRPMGEIVWFEGRVNSNSIYKAGFSDVAVTTLNTEADSNGAIPKGAKAISAQFQANDSGSAATQSYLQTRKDATASMSGFMVRTYGKTNNAGVEQTGWQPCDSSGDYQYQIEASGSGTFDSYIIYNGVQLR
jgi:hypothetical protein